MTRSTETLEHLLAQTFTPACPVFTPQLLHGREQLVDDIRKACARVGAGIVVHGGRGVGKTSLAKLAVSCIRGRFYWSASDDDTFESIASRLLDFFREARSPEDFPLRELPGLPSLTDGADVQVTLSEGRLTPHSVARLLPVDARVILIDDFDRIERPATRRAFAELVKKLSNNCVPATLILVGTTDEADELVPGAETLGSHLVSLRVPRLDGEQLRTLVLRGSELLGIDFDRTAIDCLLEMAGEDLSRVHLLAEGAVRSLLQATREGRKTERVVGPQEVYDSLAHATRTGLLDAASSPAAG